MATGNPLGRLLGRSPIAPLQQHMQLAEESVQLLCQLVQAAGDGSAGHGSEIAGLLEDCAGRARQLRRDIRHHLPRGLLLAMPRPDLLELLQLQQALVDGALAASRPLAVRGISPPPALRKSLDRLCTLVADCASQAQAAIRELDELLSQGFGDHEHKVMERALNALEKQRERCEQQQQRLLRATHRSESALDALDAIFLYRLTDDLAGLGAMSGEIGEQLRLLMAR
jgi:predicted phosphate transport protein (TIGR00153 family)